MERTTYTTAQGLARYARPLKGNAQLWLRASDAGETLHAIAEAMNLSLEEARARPGCRAAVQAGPPWRLVPGGYHLSFKGDPVVKDRNGLWWPLSAKPIGDGSVISIEWQPQAYYRLDVGAGVTLKMLGICVHDYTPPAPAPETGQSGASFYD